jgi:phosphoserine aminotransferase
MSHRSKAYLDIIESTESLFRELMNVPSNYKVLFLQGGASQQFAMIPMNLKKNGKADYVLTGVWAEKAYKEGARILDANAVASSADKKFSYIPEIAPGTLSPDADFVHICSNNTICGTRFTSLPDTGNVPLVSDMSSCILSEQVDVSKFGIIYAGAQKNIGPAGVTVVIIREDLLEGGADLPTIFKYSTHAKTDSMFNTPPTYAIYMAKLCLEWLKDQGGIAGIQKVNEAKAKILYDFLDSSSLFRGLVEKKDRSIMNVPFSTGDEARDKSFVTDAKAAGLMNLGGHRIVGGLRASIYNAVPTDSVKALVAFMKDFEQKA